MGDATLYSVLPTHYADAGIGLTSVGLILSVNRFVRLLTNGPAGWFFDRIAHRRLLFIGSLVLGIFSTLLYALASGLELLFFARLLWGIAWSGIWIGGTAIVLQMAPEAGRGRWVGIYQVWFFFGSAMGLFFGGALIDLIGYRNGLWVGAGVSTIGALAAAFALPAQRTESPGAAPLVAPSRRLSMKNPWPGLSSAMGVTAVAQGINRLASGGLVAATIGLILQQNFGPKLQIGAWQIGVASATGGLLAARTMISLIGAPLAGVLSDRFRDRWGLLAFCLMISAAGLALLPVPRLIFLTVGTIISAIAAGGVQSITTALVGDLSKGQEHGRHLGFFNIVGDLGAAVGPLLAYALLPKIELMTIYWGCGLLILINAFWVFRFNTKKGLRLLG